MERIEPLIRDLPDPDAAERFFDELSQKHPSEARKLERDLSLASDVLTIASYSPLLAATFLQNRTYFRWLGRERRHGQVREKEELLESLARFALTNSQTQTAAMLSRFRRRELIRIYLKDIRGLGTMAEITEGISNLADAILEYALQVARQELDNRYGMPLETDAHGKSARAEFCVIALGKLGSKELNYSSDIDLLFIYSSDGSTAGPGSRGKTTNREYFVKLAERVSKIVSDPKGEGGAYRVDHRLRPHGRVGSLAISLEEAKTYYRDHAQLWEKQVLIRARASAGDGTLFQDFYNSVESYVFSPDETVENALENVLRSKQKIDLEKIRKTGFDVKLGVGGIREIEFIAQALQLAYGARDKWLRAPHTLISLSRLADRELISENEFTRLHEAYVFLRRVEHRIQMEHGLQTHLVPDDDARQRLIAVRSGFDDVETFRAALREHTSNVNSIFKRFFDHTEYAEIEDTSLATRKNPIGKEEEEVIPGLTGPDAAAPKVKEVSDRLHRYAKPFLPLLRLTEPEYLPSCGEAGTPAHADRAMIEAVKDGRSFASNLAGLRRAWARQLVGIVVEDVCGDLTLSEAKSLQTELAEASIRATVVAAEHRLRELFELQSPPVLAILGLGKLGGGGMDYHSDLDLLIAYDDSGPAPAAGKTHAEFYAKAVEIFVTLLSSLTREGSLYKVDLRLRPDGRNGSTSVGMSALRDYYRERSEPWEWLAYVKARSVFASRGFSGDAETDLRSIIHEKAREFGIESLKREAKRIRARLEAEKSGGTRGRSVDLKYGEGGLQDVYFAVRFLQLATGLADKGEDRSTMATLKRLAVSGALDGPDHEAFSAGYLFLSELDHNVRLTVGRSTLVPLGNRPVLETIAERMASGSVKALLERLSFHRMAVSDAFRSVFSE